MTLTLKPNQRVSVKLDAGGTITSVPTVALKPGESVTVTAQAASPAAIRAAFYYNWFDQTWTVNGVHVAYHPILGYYKSDDIAVIDAHIRAMDYAKINVALVSWWGIPGSGLPGSAYSARVQLLLDRISVLGSPLRVGFYYEKESERNIPQAEITADLAYLRTTFGSHPATRSPLTVFVYDTAGGTATCAETAKWQAANTVGAYVNLKVFAGYATCVPQPAGWHQYGPASREQNIGTCFAISPGYHRADGVPPSSGADLVRDPVAWKQNVRDMVASGKPWHLITTFNEWGEGTAVEAASEWASPSGFGTYLDALHTDGA